MVREAAIHERRSIRREGLPVVIRCVAGEGPVRGMRCSRLRSGGLGPFLAVRPCCRPSPPAQHVPDCRDVPLAASGGGGGSGVEGGGEGGGSRRFIMGLVIGVIPRFRLAFATRPYRETR